MRTIIELPDDQISALAEYCHRKRLSRAEAVRRAVDAMLKEQAQLRERRAASLEATFGMWKERGIDTDTYLAELRSEWDR